MKKTLRFLFLTIFTASISYSQVIINEIMYNPSYSGGTSDDGDYVELFNAGQSAVDLSGYKLSDAIDFTFPSGATIAAGSYLVVGRDSVRFKEDNGFDPKTINFDIDRYIVKSTEDIEDERYILFENHQFNV